MRTVSVILLVAATVAPGAVSAGERTIDGSAAAIRTVVSGRTCTGTDVITFGRGDVGAPATFERKGRSIGNYSLGYGTILVRRGQDVHGHIASVSVADRMLYMSADTYRCAD